MKKLTLFSLFQAECCFHGDLALRGFIVTIEFRTFGTGWSLLMAPPNCQLLLATGFLVKIVVVPFHIENAILLLESASKQSSFENAS